MKDRAAPSPYVSGCEPLVPRVAYGRRRPLCGPRAFLRAPLRVSLQKYDVNLSVRAVHPSVSSALYAEGFPWPLPSVPEGPGQGKPYVRSLRQLCAAPGTYVNARPAFADSRWSQRGPPQPPPVDSKPSPSLRSVHGILSTVPVRFYFRHVFSSKSRARNKSYLVLLRTPRGTLGCCGGPR